MKRFLLARYVFVRRASSSSCRPMGPCNEHLHKRCSMAAHPQPILEDFDRVRSFFKPLPSDYFPKYAFPRQVVEIDDKTNRGRNLLLWGEYILWWESNYTFENLKLAPGVHIPDDVLERFKKVLKKMKVTDPQFLFVRRKVKRTAPNSMTFLGANGFIINVQDYKTKSKYKAIGYWEDLKTFTIRYYFDDLEEFNKLVGAISTLHFKNRSDVIDLLARESELIDPELYLLFV